MDERTADFPPILISWRDDGTIRAVTGEVERERFEVVQSPEETRFRYHFNMHGAPMIREVVWTGECTTLYFECGSGHAPPSPAGLISGWE